MRTRFSRLLASAAVFGGVLAAGGLTASASESGESQGGEAVDMKMHIAVDRFAARDGKAYASGPVTLRTQQSDGTEETTVEYASFRVRRGAGGGGDGDRTCKILRLHLSASFVALLGLEVTTSDINVKITGHRKRALGKLFCKLSEGLKLDRAQLTRKTVRSLNRRLDGDQLNIVRFNARLHPSQLTAEETQAAARAPGDGGPRCQILDLDLGPFELDLLGLAVDIYGETRESPVHIDADADPNGGALGAALCEVSGGPYDEPPA
jgi:hypothetical protein